VARATRERQERVEAARRRGEDPPPAPVSRLPIPASTRGQERQRQTDVLERGEPRTLPQVRRPLHCDAENTHHAL
jgi:hypothetical protein